MSALSVGARRVAAGCAVSSWGQRATRCTRGRPGDAASGALNCARTDARMTRGAGLLRRPCLLLLADHDTAVSAFMSQPRAGEAIGCVIVSSVPRPASMCSMPAASERRLVHGCVLSHQVFPCISKKFGSSPVEMQDLPGKKRSRFNRNGNLLCDRAFWTSLPDAAVRKSARRDAYPRAGTSRPSRVAPRRVTTR